MPGEGYAARRYRARVPSRGPAYRIVTRRLVVRCWEPRDAPLLKEAIDSSLDHLRPWMPWAQHEPQTLAEKVELLREFRGQFDLGDNSVYGIFDAAEERVLRRHRAAPADRRRARSRSATGSGPTPTGQGLRDRVDGRAHPGRRSRSATWSGSRSTAHPRTSRSAAIPRKLGYALARRGRRPDLHPHRGRLPRQPVRRGAARRLRRDRHAPHRRPRVKHWHQAPVFQGQ